MYWSFNGIKCHLVINLEFYVSGLACLKNRFPG